MRRSCLFDQDEISPYERIAETMRFIWEANVAKLLFTVSGEYDGPRSTIELETMPPELFVREVIALAWVEDLEPKKLNVRLTGSTENIVRPVGVIISKRPCKLSPFLATNTGFETISWNAIL